MASNAPPPAVNSVVDVESFHQKLKDAPGKATVFYFFSGPVSLSSANLNRREGEGSRCR